jgi:tripartite-type tricarboxylate transporter receptor subunit TctC
MSHSNWTADRRRFLSLALAGSAALSTKAFAQLQGYPSRPVKLMVGFPPGGATDVQARALAAAASREMGQSIVIINQPGVSGTLAVTTMAHSRPDGYTLAVTPSSLFRLPHLQEVSYDALHDFSLIIGLTSYVYGVAVATDGPYKTLAELVSAARKQPQAVSFGAVGVGSAGQIALHRFARAAGFEPNYVPYKGITDLVQAVIGGQLPALVDAGWGAQVDAGQLRLLGVMDAQRAKRWPQVPTMREQGYDLTMRAPVGIGGPRGMDPALVRHLFGVFQRASSDPEYIRSLELQGQPVALLSSDEYLRFAQESFVSEKRILEEMGVKPDR